MSCGQGIYIRMIPCALHLPMAWIGPDAAMPAPGSVRERLRCQAAPAWAAAGVPLSQPGTAVRVGRFEAPAWTCPVRVAENLNGPPPAQSNGGC